MPVGTEVRYYRVFDGFCSVVIGAIFMSAVFANWLLPCVPVTQLVPSPRGAISSEFKSFCTSGMPSDDSSVQDLCTCLQTSTEKECAMRPGGVPHVQQVIHWINPNFLLSVIWFAAVAYQLVLRNSLDIQWQNKGSYATMLLFFFLAAFAGISSFQHYPLTANAFILYEFFPQQFVVFVAGWAIFETIVANGGDNEEMYKITFYNGMYRVVTLPFVGVLITLLQANTDQGTLQYVYNLLLFMSLCSLSYGLVAVQEMSSHGAGNESSTSHLRLQQSTYLATLAAILVYSVFTIVFMPQIDDTVLSRLGIVFAVILWILHLLYDAANSKHAEVEYTRTFNVADAIIAGLRYALFAFVVWLCFASRDA